MDRKTLAILLITLSVLLCACPGLASLCFSPVFFSEASQPQSDFIVNDQPQPVIPLVLGILLLCVGLLGLLVPFGVGYFLLRKPRRKLTPEEMSEPLPPAI